MLDKLPLSMMPSADLTATFPDMRSVRTPAHNIDSSITPLKCRSMYTCTLTSKCWCTQSSHFQAQDNGYLLTRCSVARTIKIFAPSHPGRRRSSLTGPQIVMLFGSLSLRMLASSRTVLAASPHTSASIAFPCTLAAYGRDLALRPRLFSATDYATSRLYNMAEVRWFSSKADQTSVCCCFQKRGWFSLPTVHRSGPDR
jgi:hypothetical protein